MTTSADEQKICSYLYCGKGAYFLLSAYCFEKWKGSPCFRQYNPVQKPYQGYKFFLRKKFVWIRSAHPWQDFWTGFGGNQAGLSIFIPQICGGKFSSKFVQKYMKYILTKFPPHSIMSFGSKRRTKSVYLVFLEISFTQKDKFLKKCQINSTQSDLHN